MLSFTRTLLAAITLISSLTLQRSSAADLKKVIQRELIVVSENHFTPNYNIKGVSNLDSCFKYVFKKLWTFHDSISFISNDSLKSIIANSNPKKYVVIKLGLTLEKRSIEWENFFILGLYRGEEFIKQPNVNNNKKPITGYVFSENNIQVEEFILAIKFMVDELECEINGKSCEIKDEIQAGKSKLRQNSYYL